MKIGMIGTGNMATILGELWQNAGHDVLYGARNPAEMANRKAGTLAEAAFFGEVIVMAVNYWAIGDALATIGDVTDKLILDISNPFVLKAGATDKHNPANFERAAQVQPTALLHNIELAPQSIWVKTFCSLPGKLIKELHHQMPRIAVGYVADSENIGARVSNLITDAGFDPVYVGGVEHAVNIELGDKLSMKPMTRENMITLL